MSTDLRELFEQAIALAKTYEEKIEYLEKDLKSAKERSRRTEDMRANVQAKHDILLGDVHRIRYTAAAANAEAANWKERALNADQEVVKWKERALQAESKQGSLAAQRELVERAEQKAAQAAMNVNALLDDKKRQAQFFNETKAVLRNDLLAAQDRITELEAATLSWQTRCENAEAAEQASKTNLSVYIEELKRNTYRQGAVIDALRKENAALRNADTLVGTAPVVKQWEPKPGDWYVDFAGQAGASLFTTPDAIAFGLYRTAKEQAEGAAKAMRAYNRLLAYRDEVEPDFYAAPVGVSWYISFDRDYAAWAVRPFPAASTDGALSTLVLFKDKINATALCEKLNSGEVVL